MRYIDKLKEMYEDYESIASNYCPDRYFSSATKLCCDVNESMNESSECVLCWSQKMPDNECINQQSVCEDRGIKTHHDEEEHDDETYRLTEWGCMFVAFDEFNINLNNVSGAMGDAIFHRFMNLMERAGYIQRSDD